jgi:hypothetical protein
MAGWFMRRLQGLSGEQFTLFHAEIASGAARVRTPTKHRRNNVLRTRRRASALNHGGRDRLKMIQAGVRSAEAVSPREGIHDDSNPT